MIKTIFASCLIIAFWAGQAFSQHPAYVIDPNPEIKTGFEKLIHHERLPLRSDTILSYKVVGETRTLTARNIRTVTLQERDGEPVVRLWTENIPATGDKDNITRMVAILRYDDLQLLSLHLKSKTDSASLKWQDGHIVGWSQLPNEPRKTFDLYYLGHVTIGEGNTPWIPGLFNLDKDRLFYIPGFKIFANEIRIRSCNIFKSEFIQIGGREYLCWVADAGPSGPPGYNAYQWYEMATGRLLKTELTKKGEQIHYLSLLKL